MPAPTINLTPSQQDFATGFGFRRQDLHKVRFSYGFPSIRATNTDEVLAYLRGDSRVNMDRIQRQTGQNDSETEPPRKPGDDPEEQEEPEETWKAVEVNVRARNTESVLANLREDEGMDKKHMKQIMGPFGKDDACLHADEEKRAKRKEGQRKRRTEELDRQVQALLEYDRLQEDEKKPKTPDMKRASRPRAKMARQSSQPQMYSMDPNPPMRGPYADREAENAGAGIRDDDRSGHKLPGVGNPVRTQRSTPGQRYNASRPHGTQSARRHATTTVQSGAKKDEAWTEVTPRHRKRDGNQAAGEEEEEVSIFAIALGAVEDWFRRL